MKEGGLEMRTALVLSDKESKVGVQIENNVKEFTMRSILFYCACVEEQIKTSCNVTVYSSCIFVNNLCYYWSSF